MFFKSKRTLPHETALPLLGMCPREVKTYVHTKTRTSKFPAALFTEAETWSQHKGPATNDEETVVSMPWNTTQS